MTQDPADPIMDAAKKKKKKVKSPDQAIIVEEVFGERWLMCSFYCWKKGIWRPEQEWKGFAGSWAGTKGERNPWRILLLGDLKIEMYGSDSLMKKTAFMIQTLTKLTSLNWRQRK